MLRFDAVLLAHGIFIIKGGVAEGAPGFGVEHLDIGRDQLHGIGITGNDDRLNTLFAGLAAERAQDIIGFIVIKFKDGNVEGFHQLPDPTQLIDQLLRGLGALRLVLVEHLVAEGGRRFVKGDGVVGGFELIDGLEQHQGKAVNSADDFAGLTGQRLGVLKGMEGPVHDSIAIKKHQPGLVHRVIIANSRVEDTEN